MKKPVNIVVEESALQDTRIIASAMDLYAFVAHLPWQEAMSKLARLRYADLALFWQVIFSLRWCGNRNTGMFSTSLVRNLTSETCNITALFQDPGELGYDGDFVVFSLSEDPKQCSIDISGCSDEFPEHKIDKFTTFEEAIEVAREVQQKLIYTNCFDSDPKGFDHVFGILSCMDFILLPTKSDHKLTPWIRGRFQHMHAKYEIKTTEANKKNCKEKK